MLELRPGCENCNTALPPESTKAMICSYECTFCTNCVESVLKNVCPNCGGGFCQRPVRPAINYQGNNYLGKHPASKVSIFHPVDLAAQASLIDRIENIIPARR